MNDAQLIQALRQINAIAEQVLSGSVLPKQKVIKADAPINRPDSLSENILALREDKFFAQPKTYNEVHAKLNPSYPCDVDRVKVACLRLQRRKELRKTSKTIGNRNQVAYVW